MRRNVAFALIMLLITISGIVALVSLSILTPVNAASKPGSSNSSATLANCPASTLGNTRTPTSTPGNARMTIASPAFRNCQMIPKIYTCDGKSVNPQLIFSQIPHRAKSLALIVDDPDAPAGTWVHWVVFNVRPTTKKIGQNSVPTGSTLGTTSFGKPGYGGPCPPSGTHRYFFKLYALNTILKADTKTTKATLVKEMQGHILGQAQMIGLYRRA
jgi:Raf kinase inhibitor-like YbhB/YbcL family protein